MVSKRWTWLAALGVLFAGLTNAHSHVHYCFDGQEPPASIHLVDSTDHAHELPGHHDDGAEHEDLDLDVPNQALAKAVKYDLPAISNHVTTLSLAFVAGQTVIEDAGIPPAPSPRYVHPQLRAPPR